MELHLSRVVSKLLPVLAGAAHLIKNLENGNRIVHEGVAFGDLNDDTEIAADQILGTYFQEYFREWNAKITIEGKPDQDKKAMGSVGPHRWICVDPLDGSLNFLKRGQTIGLPYTSCVTVLERHEHGPFQFKDIQMAGTIDLRSGDVWLAERTAGQIITTLNLDPVFTSKEVKLDLKKSIVIGEMYYSENRNLLARAFNGQDGWLRNPGSAAYEMSLVSSGQVLAYICSTQKQHELGACWLETLGGGGVGVTLDGSPLSEVPFQFNVKTEAILAANQTIADQIVDLLNKAKAEQKREMLISSLPM